MTTLTLCVAKNLEAGAPQPHPRAFLGNNMNQATDLGLRMLCLNDTATVLGLSPTTLRAMVRKGQFPAPVQAHKRAMWAVATVRTWAEGKWRPAVPEVTA